MPSLSLACALIRLLNSGKLVVLFYRVCSVYKVLVHVPWNLYEFYVSLLARKPNWLGGVGGLIQVEHVILAN